MLTIIYRVLLILFAFSASTQIWANASQTASVDSVIQQYIQAYTTRNISMFEKLYARDAVVIGTGADEQLIGRKQILASLKRDFVQSNNAKITFTKINVHIQHNIAVASYNLRVAVELPDKNKFTSYLRFTATLEKTQHHWVILQSHLSAPLENQKLGNSFPDRV